MSDKCFEKKGMKKIILFSALFVFLFSCKMDQQKQASSPSDVKQSLYQLDSADSGFKVCGEIEPLNKEEQSIFIQDGKSHVLKTSIESVQLALSEIDEPIKACVDAISTTSVDTVDGPGYTVLNIVSFHAQ